MRTYNNCGGSTLQRIGGIGEDGIDWGDARDPTRILNSCGPDLIALWSDARVRALLRRKRIRLEEMPGLYVATQLTNFPEFSLNFIWVS